MPPRGGMMPRNRFRSAAGGWACVWVYGWLARGGFELARHRSTRQGCLAGTVLVRHLGAHPTAAGGEQAARGAVVLQGTWRQQPCSGARACPRHPPPAHSQGSTTVARGDTMACGGLGNQVRIRRTIRAALYSCLQAWEGGEAGRVGKATVQAWQGPVRPGDGCWQGGRAERERVVADGIFCQCIAGGREKGRFRQPPRQPSRRWRAVCKPRAVCCLQLHCP